MNETDRRPGDENNKRFKFCDDVVYPESNFKTLFNFYSDVYDGDREQVTTNENRIVNGGTSETSTGATQPLKMDIGHSDENPYEKSGEKNVDKKIDSSIQKI